MTLRVDRRQVLAYRAAAQGLHREAAAAPEVAVLDLGAQDTPPGAAAHALANRLASPVGSPADDLALTTTWSLRGAPHVHRADELVALSRALWPWSDSDALARLDTSSSPVRSSGMSPRDALRFVAEHIADIVTEPMPKGEVSTALTPRVPDAMTVDCRPCQATHIVETLFRSAVLHAGITFEPRARTVTFVPASDWPGVPEETAGAEDVIRGYLRLLGPATETEVAAFLQTTAVEVGSRWPDGLAAVEVDGRRAWIPEEAIGALSSPPDAPSVRLLPPSDPWLQARDRELTVPDAEHRKTIWPILGRPGVVLADGEVVATWRARKKGRRLDLAVTPFRALPATLREGVEEEAQLAARARGSDRAEVAFD